MTSSSLLLFTNERRRKSCPLFNCNTATNLRDEPLFPTLFQKEILLYKNKIIEVRGRTEREVRLAGASVYISFHHMEVTRIYERRAGDNWISRLFGVYEGVYCVHGIMDEKDMSALRTLLAELSGRSVKEFSDRSMIFIHMAKLMWKKR